MLVSKIGESVLIRPDEWEEATLRSKLIKTFVCQRIGNKSHKHSGTFYFSEISSGIGESRSKG
jgi:hypothetical protein